MHLIISHYIKRVDTVVSVRVLFFCLLNPMPQIFTGKKSNNYLSDNGELWGGGLQHEWEESHFARALQNNYTYGRIGSIHAPWQYFKD